MNVLSRSLAAGSLCVLQRLTLLQNLTHSQSADQIPAALAGEALPCLAIVAPEQAPEQQDVADLHAPQSGSAAVRALISIREVAPIGVAMGTSASHVTDVPASPLR